MRRRTFLAIGATVGTVAGLAGYRSRSDNSDPVIPYAPVGDERLERRDSRARGRLVDFYTAVPSGHGSGRGLPVCIVLHGASKTAADYPELGLGRFLTDSVRRGNAPFVLAGATGDRLAWRPHAGDDPQRMVHEEIPRWCAERGFDTSRIVLLGWSMGGYGSLLLAEAYPGFARAVVALSPAVRESDEIFRSAGRLRGTKVGLWCGRQDGLLGDVRALAEALPEPPAAGSFSDGRHNFGYWSRCLPAGMDFVSEALRR
ncbi:esterase [Actinoplanes sp. LDG1-06]|uniref:Esterase n=1 Tax=Paractinoplanes ovalisporus TaxID=2810368 RepID=A0ABS2AJH0_9ACTN|nr:alpha/beta hydrolase-fold protein [Actinoplanes ovalisporus]MBM2619992.1 esterase [Actinoplanes ovalisporus]